MDPMTAAVPAPAASAAPRRAPELERALTALRTHTDSAFRRHDRLQRYDAQMVAQILSYVERLEGAVLAEQRRRRAFEAEAEGEFADLRLQRAAWHRYAEHLRERLEGLGDLLVEVMGTATPRPRRWWHGRARRERDAAIQAALDDVWSLAMEPLPAAPTEPAA